MWSSYDKGFAQAPEASHFLIAHSHDGNIVMDALRAPGIVEHVSGIVTMSTRFVSSRRSGIRITAVVLSVLAQLAFVVLVYFLCYGGLFWIWNQAEAHITSPLLLWPARLLLLFLAANWAGQIAELPYEVASETAEHVWGAIEEWQNTFLERFDYQLKQPIPMFCIRFRMDEALMVLNLSRFFVKPLRILTFAASWLVAAGGLVFLILWSLGPLLGFLAGFLDFVFSTKLTESISPMLSVVFSAALTVFMFSIAPTVLFLIIWTVTGYVMGALTLGHWGGVISQLLLDFRITGTPEGATAVTKIYSPLRWRRTLLHSLTYSDSKAVADISQWIASRMCNDGGDRVEFK